MNELVSVNDVKLCVTYKQGKQAKKPFVFIHGAAQNDTSGKTLKDFFSSKGHSVLSYDLPGHGNSTPYTDDIGIVTMAETHAAVLSHYGVECSISAGHSLGGMILLKYAVMNPESIEGLLLIDTSDVDPIKVNETITLDDLLSIFEASRNMFKEQKKFDFDPSKHLTEEEIAKASLEFTDPLSFERATRATIDYDVRKQLLVLSTPTLILRGSDDAIMTGPMNLSMCERIRGAHYLSVKGLGHNWFLQRPDKMNQILESNYNWLVRYT